MYDVHRTAKQREREKAKQTDRRRETFVEHTFFPSSSSFFLSPLPSMQCREREKRDTRRRFNSVCICCFCLSFLASAFFLFAVFCLVTIVISGCCVPFHLAPCFGRHATLYSASRHPEPKQHNQGRQTIHNEAPRKRVLRRIQSHKRRRTGNTDTNETKLVGSYSISKQHTGRE